MEMWLEKLDFVSVWWVMLCSVLCVDYVKVWLVLIVED